MTGTKEVVLGYDKGLELGTMEAVKRAVSKAKAVYVRPRFGLSEKWVKISKTEAEYLIQGVTNESMVESGTSPFGKLNVTHNEVYLG